MGHDVGASGFLYPFLGERAEPHDSLVEEVANSVLMKSQDARALREQVVQQQAGAIARAVAAIAMKLDAGGKLILFGNGGSATDATDWALDCVMPEDGAPPIRAISLSLEPAIITAVANDVGVEVIFLRQLVAQARPHDVAIALSTSGGSKNIVAALEEARKRGMLTIALLGYDGGEIARRGLADIPIVVHCDYIPRIQEVQATIYHVIREALEAMRADAA
jgi:D-sedoheptulose 7-phosphate isomerase